MLRDVFAECHRTLEPGGRMAINVANLGRKPYRSLAADVIGILQDDLGMLLRGEVIWVKARGSAGSCAWGSFQRPANPVLRDLSERVIIASKGRFDRALSARAAREARSSRAMRRCTATSSWKRRPTSGRSRRRARLVSATRRRSRSIFRSASSTSTPTTATSCSIRSWAPERRRSPRLRTERHFVGYDTDDEYVAQGARVYRCGARADREVRRARRLAEFSACPPFRGRPRLTRTSRRARSARGRRQRTSPASARRLWVYGCDCQCEAPGWRRGQLQRAGRGRQHSGTSTCPAGSRATDPGLKRTDTLWKALGKAAVINAGGSRRSTGAPHH